jgi:hypothetical protein
LPVDLSAVPVSLPSSFGLHVVIQLLGLSFARAETRQKVGIENLFQFIKTNVGFIKEY